MKLVEEGPPTFTACVEPAPRVWLAWQRVRWAVQEAGYLEPPVTIGFYRGLWARDGERLAGYCYGAPGETQALYIEARQAFGAVVDTMLHEMAHAIAYQIQNADAEPHSALWGVIYADLTVAYNLDAGPDTVVARKAA